jgi:hypothetical protein
MTAGGFDPSVHTGSDLRKMPINVIKTEIPELAKALGVEPAELFRSLSGGASEGAAASKVGAEEYTCCHSDSW